MRKLVFIGFVVLGALLGLLSATKDDWATRAVMMGIGALFGAPIGAVLARRNKKGTPLLEWDETPHAGIGTTPKDLSANYWRDRGHPPFMKPAEAEPSVHAFDPDKVG